MIDASIRRRPGPGHHQFPGHLFNQAGEIVSRAQHPFRQIYPQPGWVEHDPLDIWPRRSGPWRRPWAPPTSTPSRSPPSASPTSGDHHPLGPGHGTAGPQRHRLQCRRTAPLCDELKEQGLGPLVTERTGLLIDAYFSGTKIRWLLDHVPGARQRAERGELCAGTVDSWLIWNLTGGGGPRDDYYQRLPDHAVQHP